MPSFSSLVKAELCRESLNRPCCVCAEAYGVLLYANTFSAREIRIVTGSRDFAQRLPKLFRRAFSVSFDTQPQPGRSGKFTFGITDGEKISAIFDKYGYDARTALVHHINLGVLEEDCCRAAFIRGAYLAGGSITDPSKRCHMELATDHVCVARETLSILLDMGFEPHISSRGGHSVIYFKRAEAIEDLFTTIGASSAALAIMSAKVEKEMYNAINRRVNCDSANADKIVSAAQAQLERIRQIERESGLDSLPEELQELALLRIANPEASLADLAALSCPPVSKSCISHRLRRLINYGQE